MAYWYSDFLVAHLLPLLLHNQSGAIEFSKSVEFLVESFMLKCSQLEESN